MLASLRKEFEDVLGDQDESYTYQINYAPGRSIMRDKLPAGCYQALDGLLRAPEDEGDGAPTSAIRVFSEVCA
jgi:hypothetical protein